MDLDLQESRIFYLPQDKACHDPTMAMAGTSSRVNSVNWFSASHQIRDRRIAQLRAGRIGDVCQSQGIGIYWMVGIVVPLICVLIIAGLPFIAIGMRKIIGTVSSLTASWACLELLQIMLAKFSKLKNQS